MSNILLKMTGFFRERGRSENKAENIAFFSSKLKKCHFQQGQIFLLGKKIELEYRY